MDPTQTPRFGVDEAMDAMECAVGKLLRGTERSRDPFRREKREPSRSCQTTWDGSADVDASRPVVQRVARALVFAGKGYEDTAKRALGGALFVEEELVHADGEIVMWE
eukprot:jgi/Pico_ML_1/55066/g818.t1